MQTKTKLTVIALTFAITYAHGQWLPLKEQRNNLLGLEIKQKRLIGNPSPSNIIMTANGKTEDIEGVKKGFEIGLTGLNFSYGKIDSVYVKGVKIDYIDWQQVINLAQNRTIVYKGVRADSVVLLYTKNFKANATPTELLQNFIKDTVAKVFPFLEKAKITIKDSSEKYSKITITDATVYYKFQGIRIERLDTKFRRVFAASLTKPGTTGQGTKGEVDLSEEEEFDMDINENTNRVENYPVYSDNSMGPRINLKLRSISDTLRLFCEIEDEPFCQQNNVSNCEIEITPKLNRPNFWDYRTGQKFLGKVSYGGDEYWVFLFVRAKTKNKTAITVTNISYNGGSKNYETYLYYPKVKYSFYKGKIKE